MEYIVFTIVALLLLALVGAKGIYDAVIEKKNFLYSLRHNYGVLRKREYGLDRYCAISRYFTHHKMPGQIDEITFQDLSMDDIFKSMNFTNCQAGAEVLYYMLRTPDYQNEPLAHKEELIRYFEEHEDDRVALQYALHQAGYTGKFSLYDYLENLNLLGKRSNFRHYLLLILYIILSHLHHVDP